MYIIEIIVFIMIYVCTTLQFTALKGYNFGTVETEDGESTFVLNILLLLTV